MSTELSNNERELFHRLIAASGKLATTAELASDVLSEEHEDMCKPFIEEVRHIIAQCPSPDPAAEWDGELRESDLEIKTYRVAARDGMGGQTVDPIGVKIIHIPTGIGRQSESKPSQLQNREVVMKALTEAVAKEYQRRGVKP